MGNERLQQGFVLFLAFFFYTQVWPVLMMLPVRWSSSSCKSHQSWSSSRLLSVPASSLYKNSFHGEILHVFSLHLLLWQLFPQCSPRQRPFTLQPSVAGSLSQGIKPKQRESLLFTHLCISDEPQPVMWLENLFCFGCRSLEGTASTERKMRESEDYSYYSNDVSW